ncbi:cyclic pyranopterin monophosphate synthase MoaC [Chelativorans xinjiangense]|uniref:cyclic pyranopterin monophosphate synthase MoaC n=1 Tax=Chelativorans xinjiangense TaxID=2681485 RepID=UPI00135AD750|nr:cyclic pyranopterin monophosphate synthase MoaC [Chelativorans xinjiangense]
MAGDEKSGLTHLAADGRAEMVDVGAKDDTARTAVAAGAVTMAPQTLRAILAGDAKKGDVIAVARLAGIMAAKKTHDLIPLCHPLALTKIAVDIAPDEALPGLRVEATARVTGKTGVEMEALTAVSIACLTIYDMAKALDKGMVIGEVHLKEKTGGRSGAWRAQGADDGSASG